MTDYIEFPRWLKIEEIQNSKIISRFIKTVEIIDNKIDLDYLRKLYVSNQDEYRQLVDEMVLRGFRFVTHKPNNVLPKIEVNDNVTLLTVNEDKRIYVHINFKDIGITNFISRFNVESDLFFDKIPVKGFAYLNKNINEELLVTELREYGFIKNFDSDILVDDDRNNDIAITKKFVKFKGNKVSDIKFTTRTNNLLMRNSIFTIEELLLLDRETVSEWKNAGKKSIDELFNVIEMINENKFKPSLYSDQDKVSIFDNYGFSTRAINALKSNQVQDMDELALLTYEGILSFENVGIKTVDEIISRVEEWKNTPEYKSKLADIKINISKNILDEYGDLKLNSIIDEPIEGAGLLRELNGKSYNELKDQFEKPHIAEQIVKFIKGLKTFEEIIQNIDITSRELRTLKCRFLKGYTLEEIGENFHVTRERVRQIQLKGEKKVFNTLFHRNFFRNLSLINENKKTIDVSIVRKAVCQNDLYYSIIEKSKISPINYDAIIDIFFEDNYEEFNKIIEELLERQDDVFEIIEIIDEFVSIAEEYDISNLTITMIEQIISNNGMFVYGEVASKKRLSTIDIIVLIYRDYIDGALRFDDDGFEYIRAIAENQLNFMDLATNVRGLDNRLREVEELVLIDKKTYIHISKIEYDKTVINTLDMYLEAKLKEKKVVSIEAVINENYSLLVENDIYNKRMIYSLLKKNLNDKYDFGRKNTLNIYSMETPSALGFREILIKYIQESNGIANKKELLRELGWTQLRLDNTINNYPDFISIGNNMLKLAPKIKYTQDEEEKLNRLIDRRIEKGYVGIEALFLDMKFDPTLNQYIRKNKIENSLVLAQILKMRYPDLVGRSSVLFSRKSKYRTIEHVILEKYEVTSRDELKMFLDSLGYSKMASYNVIMKLMAKKKYIEISTDEIIRHDLFVIPERCITALKTFIEPKLQLEGYVSLKNISGYRKVLPEMNFRWNPYIIRSILLRNGYKEIKRKIGDNRTDLLILLKKETIVSEFYELCFQVIKNHYSGNMHESKVYDFLADRGLLIEREHRFNKRLPSELRDNSLIEVDEVGKVCFR